METIWSSVARSPETERDRNMLSASGMARAISPVALIITVQGSSSISKAMLCSPAFFAAATSAAADDTVLADLTASSAEAETPVMPSATTGVRLPSASASSSTVRRGVPYSATAPSISSTTTRSSALSDARMRSSSSMRLCRSSRSDSSSMRLILVSLRRRRSRIYCAWMSSRSNTAINRVLAASAFSEERMTWITSSMSISASNSPSTRCSRSSAFVRRNSLRRLITTRRWSIHTWSISLSPMVCGRPLTNATLFMAKLSCNGVCLSSCTSTACGSKPVFSSITKRVPLWRSLRSIAPEMPSSL